MSTAPSVPNSNTPTSQNQSPIIPPPNQNYPQGQPNPEFYNRQDQVRTSFITLIAKLNFLMTKNAIDKP